MTGKKRITRAEQDKASTRLKSDSPKLSKRKKRSDANYPTHADLARIESLTAVGMPMDVVAAECNVSRDVLERWAREYSDIASAIRKGRKRRRMRAVSCLFEQAFPVATDKDGRVRPTGKGNPQLMQFWFRTREGISERVADEKAIKKFEAQLAERGLLGSASGGGQAGPRIIYNVRELAIEDDDDGSGEKTSTD